MSQPALAFGLAVASTFAVVGDAAAAAESEANTVQAITQQTTPQGRTVIIKTSGEPKFFVYRLSNPFRVLIDIDGATLDDQVTELLQGEDHELIRHVSTKHFDTDGQSIVRVEIALERRLPYDVSADGNTIVAKIELPATRSNDAKEAVSSAAKPSTPEAAPATPSPAASVLGRLARKVRKDRVVLSAAFDGTPDPSAVSIMELEDPTRVVIDIAGAVAAPKYQKVKFKKNKLRVRRARLATNDDGVRIVMDLAKGAELPQVDVDAIDGKLQVSVTEAKIAEAPAAKPVEVVATQVAKAEPVKAEPVKAEPVKAEPAKAVATQVAKAEPAAKVREARTDATVADVRFEPRDGFMRLTVELAGDADVARDRSGTRSVPRLRLSNATLPEALVRTLDTSALAGKVVTAISTFNDGHDVVIAAKVGGETEHRHWRKGKLLMWDFRSHATAKAPTPAPAARVASRVLPYAERATSGYENKAASFARAVNTGRKRYRGRRISLDLKDADIKNVLRLLADVSKLNIVAADDVSGKITLKLRNVPWDQALDIILQAKRLDKTRNGNIMRVAPIEVLEQEEQLRLSRRDAQQKLEPMSVRLLPVNYADAPEIKKQVTALLSDRGKVNVDARTNVLVVEDIAEVLLKVERLVRTLDTQTPQVLIEARIVEAATNFARDLGIQWGGSAALAPHYGTQTGLQFPSTVSVRGGAEDAQTPRAGVDPQDNGFAINLPAAAGLGSGGALGFLFGSAGGSTLLALRLTAAEQQGKTKIISAPKVVTLDNTEAKILSGEKIPITVLTANGPSTRFVDANLELKVTPHVTSDGSILMEVTAKKNELSQRQDILGTPGIVQREARTEMLVRDGDTAVLGGIYRRTAFESKAYVPWIGQVPVLGWLFKKTNRSDSREELLIFISPRIVNRSESLVAGG